MENKILFKKLLLVSCLSLMAAFLLFSDKAEAKVLIPNAVGFHTGWTGVYTDVDEYPINDGNSTYNSISAAGAQTYNLMNNSDTGSIRGIRVVIYARVSGTQEELYPVLRVNSNDYAAPAACSDLDNSGYKFCSYYWSLNPYNSSTWSTSDLNSLEAGFKTIQVGGTWEDASYRVSQLYVDVDFKTETKKIKYHLFQKINAVNGAIDEEFSFFIGDPVNSVQSAFIEIKGLATPSSVNLGVKVDNTVSTPGAYDATYAVDSTGRPTLFKINYDVTNYFKEFVTNSGTYQRYIHINTDNNVYLLNAKLIIVYDWIIPPTAAGQYQAKGEAISVVFDTTSDGAAYNSITWKGILGNPTAGKVRLKIATSDSDSGPWSYLGPASNCSSAESSDSDWYVLNPNEPAEIKCSSHNNKRYFRYKVQLCSNSDCLNSGNGNPRVDDIIISWSP